MSAHCHETTARGLIIASPSQIQLGRCPFVSRRDCTPELLCSPLALESVGWAPRFNFPLQIKPYRIPRGSSETASRLLKLLLMLVLIGESTAREDE